jgi:peptide/nickel transport system substrate-binding protein
MRDRVSLFVAVVLVLCAAAGCGGKGKQKSSATYTDSLPLPEEPLVSTAPEIGTHGGRMIVSEISAPKTFNYLIANEQSSTDITTQLFDGLVTFNNATQKTEPALATRWELSADSLSWTFHLRRGARFSDGTPITSADFRFAYDVVMDETITTPVRSSFLVEDKPVTIETPDESTVVFHTPVPYGGFAELVAGNLYCMPKHVLERQYKAGQYASAYGTDTAPESLVTSGPFMLEQYVPNEKVVLKRNPYYYLVDREDRRMPYLDQVVYVIVPDQNTELLKFQAGETDVIELPRPEDHRGLKQDAGAKDFTLYECGPSLRTNFFWFNLNKKKDRVTPAVAAHKYAWFSQADFRYALAHAVDRDAIVKNVFYGLAVENWAPSTQGNKNWYDPDVSKYPYDPAKSKALLAGLGYKDTNGDGILEDGAGHEIEFSMITNSSNTARMQMMTMIQEDLRKVGVRVHPRGMDFNELVTHIQSDFNYECALLGLASGVPPDPVLSSNVYKSSGMTHFWNVNQPRPETVWEARVDSLMDGLSVTFSADAKKRMWSEVQRLLTQKCVFIYLPTQVAYAPVRNRFGNLRPGVIPPPVAWNAREIYVKKGAGG